MHLKITPGEPMNIKERKTLVTEGILESLKVPDASFTEPLDQAPLSETELRILLKHSMYT